jgi:hypothetical protein
MVRDAEDWRRHMDYCGLTRRNPVTTRLPLQFAAIYGSLKEVI